MNIYSALNQIEVEKRGLTINAFTDEIREQIDSEEEKN